MSFNITSDELREIEAYNRQQSEYNRSSEDYEMYESKTSSKQEEDFGFLINYFENLNLIDKNDKQLFLNRIKNFVSTEALGSNFIRYNFFRALRVRLLQVSEDNYTFEDILKIYQKTYEECFLDLQKAKEDIQEQLKLEWKSLLDSVVARGKDN